MVLVAANAGSIGHHMGYVGLLSNTKEQVTHRSGGMNADVLTAVGLILQREARHVDLIDLWQRNEEDKLELCSHDGNECIQR